MSNELVHIHDKHAKTTSLIVAEKFGKRHDNVLRAITKLIAECSDEELGLPKIGESSDELGLLKIEESSDFGRRNFAPSSYINEQNKTQPMYHITRDGFSLLVMGFTGKEALKWKLKFIAAFNTLEAQVLERLQSDVQWEADHIEQAKAYWFKLRPHWKPIYELLIGSSLEPKSIAERIGKSVTSVRRAIHRMIEVGILHPRLVREAIKQSAFARQLTRSGVLDRWGKKAKQLDLFALEV